MQYNYPVFNPYNPMQQFVPQQQFQQQIPYQQVQQQQVGLQGKIVESSDVVKGIDIPMDGTVYYFPKADGSEVYSKRWLSNGTTEQIVYKKEVVESDSDKPNPFMEKLNGIEEKIVALEELLSKQPKASSKKEG